MASDSAFHAWLGTSNECTDAPSLETAYSVDLSPDSDTAMMLSTVVEAKLCANRPVSTSAVKRSRPPAVATQMLEADSTSKSAQ